MILLYVDNAMVNFHAIVNRFAYGLTGRKLAPFFYVMRRNDRSLFLP